VKFKIDENLPAEIADDLKAAGHDADTVGDQGLAGAADQLVLSRVQSDGRIFLTMDKGIADVRAYPPLQYPGIILFRLRSAGRSSTYPYDVSLVRKALPTLLRLPLAGHLFVVSETSIRMR
jgi:predicted nuclease of predicted toxin-antitoxin system